MATDFSPTSQAAIARACEVAGHGAAIDVVSAWTPPRIDSLRQLPGEAEIVEPMLRWLREQGEALVARHRSADHEIAFHAVVGSAAGAIVDFAEAGHHDLVVVGSHGRRGVRRFLLGSVAEAVVRAAPCSVLVARGAA